MIIRSTTQYSRNKWLDIRKIQRSPGGLSRKGRRRRSPGEFRAVPKTVSEGGQAPIYSEDSAKMSQSPKVRSMVVNRVNRGSVTQLPAEAAGSACSGFDCFGSNNSSPNFSPLSTAGTPTAIHSGSGASRR